MKNSPFVLGALIFLYGAVCHIPNLNMPYDARAIEVSFLAVTFSLDVISLVLGTLIMCSVWLMSRLLDL